MTGETPNPLDVLRMIRDVHWPNMDAYEQREFDAALAQVEALAEAAQNISECNDYWDWVTGYAPQLKAALVPFAARENTNA